MNDLHTAMADAGLIPHSPIAQQPDGRMARFRVEGDKAGSKNGWLIRYSHPTELAVFGSWKTGVQHTWRPKSSTVTSPSNSHFDFLNGSPSRSSASKSPNMRLIVPKEPDFSWSNWGLAAVLSPEWVQLVTRLRVVMAETIQYKALNPKNRRF